MARASSCAASGTVVPITRARFWACFTRSAICALVPLKLALEAMAWAAPCASLLDRPGWLARILVASCTSFAAAS